MENLIILAAGEGTRLRPYTKKTPKCMVKLKGKTILERNIQEWMKSGNFEITIVTGYKSECINNKKFYCIICNFI